MSENVYEMDPAELLVRFEAEVTGRAGSVIPFRTHLLRGAVLARIEGRKPPFSHGDSIRPARGDVNTLGQQRIKSGTVREVAVVYYEGDGRWTLSLKGDVHVPQGPVSHPDGHHQAEEFELVTK